ncbi:ATP-binding cassette domain-containing protein [Robiginitalea sediminis]|uniref:ATP-binding cassette domain-containing protein n=1 Tax=Robiginitalea sediminis TaxID=1982593 RepID=UPI000B4C00F5|nr:ATP-binding cassette domain-containing protein [Robiginitalea sediminis]
MPELPHVAIYTGIDSRKESFFEQLLQGEPPIELKFLKGKRGALFSNARIAAFIEEEARHQRSSLTGTGERGIRTYSSGERKKALLAHLMAQNPDFLILDDPFDNLDRQYQQYLRSELEKRASEVILVQLVSRPEDRLELIRRAACLEKDGLVGFPEYQPGPTPEKPGFKGRIPPPPHPPEDLPDPLIQMKAVNLHYEGRPVLNNIDLEVFQGDFWELRGPNGSGKSSLITMIVGDNPKAYGQEITLFGQRKGSGESVWDIKSHLGYFTPGMADRFRGYHSVENMLISGLTDSIGLYIQPSETQRLLAAAWLRVLDMEQWANTPFRDLSEGQKRLIFCARAMVKHPALLILDEPTAGLDGPSARKVVALINKMAKESQVAVIFVSHRDEPGLKAYKTLELKPSETGSSGQVFV